MTIAYRPAELSDAKFVVSQWSRCFKGNRSSGMIADEDWAAVMHAQVQKLLNRPGVRTIIAYENTDPDFLYGFISYDVSAAVPVVYFTCVKEAYRRGGYARGLFAAAGIDPEKYFAYAYWTPTVIKIAKRIPFAKHEPDYARITGYVKTRNNYGNDDRQEAQRPTSQATERARR